MKKPPRDFAGDEMTSTTTHRIEVARHSVGASRFYFVLLVCGLWFGVGLPAFLGGIGNVFLVLIAVYSGYELFSKGATF